MSERREAGAPPHTERGPGGPAGRPPGEGAGGA